MQARNLWRRFRKMSVYTRLVLVMSAVLILGGAVLFALLEWNNPATLGGLSVGGKILAAMFQSVTTRTAGFYTVNQGALTDASLVLTDLLMLIGGSSGSTAGGIKTVTVAVLILSVLATARGKSRVTVFHRTIHPKQISDAVSVVGMVLKLAQNLTSTSVLDYVELSGECGLEEILAPKSWVGKTLPEIDVRKKFGVTVAALRKSDGDVTVFVDADYRLKADDELIVVGRNEDLERVQKL